MTEYKQYKSDSPEETIHRIRIILKNIGITLKENSYEKDGLYACTLSINNGGKSAVEIGAYGKGRSYEYALASGYAEFMERLQNGVIYPKTPLYYISQQAKLSGKNTPLKKTILDGGLQMDFLYEPNERTMNPDEVIDEFDDDLSEMFHVNKNSKDFKSKIKSVLSYEGKKVRMVPVFSYKHKKVIFYPISWALLATGTNGMCAGNTPSEAILQGMCEIFERYSEAQIFFKQLTPPTIPVELFKGSTAYEKIQELTKQYGFEFIIKDCSLGKGLPVIGLIIVNHNNRTYNFKLGSDFVPHIALERCLTEAYQNKHGFIGIPILSTPRGDVNDSFSRTLRSGSGEWPSSIFYATQSYEFIGFNESLGKDNSTDLKYAYNLIKNLGSNLYIRDNSFLGFPSYYVIAPGLSSVRQDIDDIKKTIEAEPSYIISKYKMKLNIDNLADFTKDVELSLKKNISFDFNDLIPFYNSRELKYLHPYLFLCMAHYYMEDYIAAYDYIIKYLEGKGKEYEYYYAVSEYILNRFLKKVCNIDIESLLVIKYGQRIAQEVIKDMCIPKNVFKYYNFKKHFDWNNMDTNKESSLIDILKIEKKIQQKKLENPIHQEKLKQLFQ